MGGENNCLEGESVNNGVCVCVCYRNSTAFSTSLRQEIKATLVSHSPFNSLWTFMYVPSISLVLPGIYFYDYEILPAHQGVWRWNGCGEAVNAFSPEVEVRAIVEGQFMAKWLHAQRDLASCSRVLMTGGASQNDKIRQAS